LRYRPTQEDAYGRRKIQGYDATAGFAELWRAADFVAGPVESLAEVWARRRESRCVELRVLLEQRAAGMPVRLSTTTAR